MNKKDSSKGEEIKQESKEEVKEEDKEEENKKEKARSNVKEMLQHLLKMLSVFDREMKQDEFFWELHASMNESSQWKLPNSFHQGLKKKVLRQFGIGYEFNQEELASPQDQTVLGKDYTQSVIADKFAENYNGLSTPCYDKEALARSQTQTVIDEELSIPEQTATGKGTSNPLMAGSLPKTTKPTHRYTVSSLMDTAYRNKDLHDEIERISKESKDVSNESKTVDTACNDAFEVKQELSKRIVELEKDLLKSEAKGIAFEIVLQHKSRENNSLKTVQKENKNFMASLQLENAHLKQTYKDLFESVQRTAKFEAYFEKLENTKVILERQLARKVDDSKAEKD
ncbi:hypothetical protein Tco_0261419 [Tanacetum coccineum]